MKYSVNLFIFITSFLGRRNKKLQGFSFCPKKPERQTSHHIKPTRLRVR